VLTGLIMTTSRKDNMALRWHREPAAYGLVFEKVLAFELHRYLVPSSYSTKNLQDK
jgi:hypothetical protein